MVPTIDRSTLIQSDVERNVLYVMRADPREDFDLTDNHNKLRMTATRHFVDRGAPCVEYRPNEWCPNMDLRVRIYWWGASEARCGQCSTCSCKTAKHSEDAGT